MSAGPPTLIKERLETFAAVFLADPRPGLVFEFGRLVLVNEAARKLLVTRAADFFLEELKASLRPGSHEPGLTFQTQGGTYAPVLHSGRISEGHPTVICFLVRQREVAAALETLSERELGVFMLLVKGLTNAEIAGELRISVETVRKHVSKALEKTGSRTRAGLVGCALGR